MGMSQGIYIFVALIGILQTLQIWQTSRLIAKLEKLVSEEACEERRTTLTGKISGVLCNMDCHTHKDDGGMVLYHPYRRRDD